MEELIQAKIHEIYKKEEEKKMLILEIEIEEEARLRIETKKLNDAIQSKDIKTIRLLAGVCKDLCEDCYICITGGSYIPIIKNKARLELNIN